MSVVVKYKTEKTYCSCCQQKLPEVKTSDYKAITITKEDAISWGEDWNEIADYPEDMEALVPEFVHEHIDFCRLNSYERCIVEDSEIEKVAEFILREVVTNTAEGHQSTE